MNALLRPGRRFVVCGNVVTYELCYKHPHANYMIWWIESKSTWIPDGDDDLTCDATHTGVYAERNRADIQAAMWTLVSGGSGIK